jgi:hypothetical protein
VHQSSRPLCGLIKDERRDERAEIGMKGERKLITRLENFCKKWKVAKKLLVRLRIGSDFTYINNFIEKGGRMPSAYEV